MGNEPSTSSFPNIGGFSWQRIDPDTTRALVLASVNTVFYSFQALPAAFLCLMILLANNRSKQRARNLKAYRIVAVALMVAFSFSIHATAGWIRDVDEAIGDAILLLFDVAGKPDRKGTHGVIQELPLATRFGYYVCLAALNTTMMVVAAVWARNSRFSRPVRRRRCRLGACLMFFFLFTFLAGSYFVTGVLAHCTARTGDLPDTVRALVAFCEQLQAGWCVVTLFVTAASAFTASMKAWTYQMGLDSRVIKNTRLTIHLSLLHAIVWLKAAWDLNRQELPNRFTDAHITTTISSFQRSGGMYLPMTGPGRLLFEIFWTWAVCNATGLGALGIASFAYTPWSLTDENTEGHGAMSTEKGPTEEKQSSSETANV